MKRDDVRLWLARRIADIRGVAVESIDSSERFVRHRLDSLAMTRLLVELSRETGRSLPPTLAWEYPSIELLAAHVAQGAVHATSQGKETGSHKAGGSNDPIAIVGMACRFPGSPNIDEFWKLLTEGRDAITEVPPDRWSIGEFYDEDPNAPGKMRTKWGGFIDHVDEFDPQFFGISPREAVQMAPQQRLMLELAWEALEDAGIAPLPGRKRMQPSSLARF